MDDSIDRQAVGELEAIDSPKLYHLVHSSVRDPRKRKSGRPKPVMSPEPEQSKHSIAVNQTRRGEKRTSLAGLAMSEKAGTDMIAVLFVFEEENED